MSNEPKWPFVEIADRPVDASRSRPVDRYLSLVKVAGALTVGPPFGVTPFGVGHAFWGHGHAFWGQTPITKPHP